MGESRLRSLSLEFAINMVKLCEGIKGHRSLANQMERAATSIGANIHEANYAHGRADFISKMQIALKECYETEYWLELLYRKGKMDEDMFGRLRNDCGSIRRRLIASITTVKSNS